MLKSLTGAGLRTNTVIKGVLKVDAKKHPDAVRAPAGVGRKPDKALAPLVGLRIEGHASERLLWTSAGLAMP
jgi:hypothetical protein